MNELCTNISGNLPLYLELSNFSLALQLTLLIDKGSSLNKIRFRRVSPKKILTLNVSFLDSWHIYVNLYFYLMRFVNILTIRFYTAAINFDITFLIIVSLWKTIVLTISWVINFNIFSSDINILAYLKNELTPPPKHPITKGTI